MALENKEIELCAFLDIQRAFDNTTLDAIDRASDGKGIVDSISRWIKSMLKSREIQAELGQKKRMTLRRGYIPSIVDWCSRRTQMQAS